MIEKLASAIYNDLVGGLAGINSNPSISLVQLEDDVVDEWLQIIKEYSMKNIIPKRDLLMGIHCIDVDCKSLDKCPCGTSNYSTPIAHFEMPQIINDLASGAIDYIGSIDRQIQFKVYTSNAFQYHKYSRRGANKPLVYIETTPNQNNMYDAWIFNAPLLKKISVVAIFKDLRQLQNYECCGDIELDNFTFIAAEIKKRLTEKKLRYYRSFIPNPQPNNQVAR